MASSQDSSEYYFDDYDDSQFLNAIHEAVLPGDAGYHSTNNSNTNANLQGHVQAHAQDGSTQARNPDGADRDIEIADSQESEEFLEPPPPAQPRRSPSPSHATTATSRSSLKRKHSQTQDEDDTSGVESFGSLGLGGSIGSTSGASGSGSAGGSAGIAGGAEEVDEAVYGASRFGNFGEYMRRKRAKLQIQNADIVGSQQGEGTEGGSRIFKGLSIYINGWTQPSVQDLRKLIVEHGGVFQPYLDKKGLVTHIITCSLTPAKIREFKNMKVLLRLALAFLPVLPLRLLNPLYRLPNLLLTLALLALPPLLLLFQLPLLLS
ncbi:hypothetical protein H1R20_g13691, partial [Candolleomyces eurysporus]